MTTSRAPRGEAWFTKVSQEGGLLATVSHRSVHQDPIAMASNDQRRFPRVEFFFVTEAHEQLPVWVIKPERETLGRAGVVVNLSGGGLQIAMSADEALQGQHYELRLLLGESQGVPLFTANVRLVWSRPLNLSAQLGGFEFETHSSEAEQFLLVQTAHVASRRWVRCVLVERMTALA